MILIRSVSFVIVAVSALFLPMWVFALLSFLYAFVFSPYELLAVGVLVDAQFGSLDSGMWYRYTAIASGVFIISSYIRPYLSFYRI